MLMDQFLIQELDEQLIEKQYQNLLNCFSDGFGLSIIEKDDVLKIFKEKSKLGHKILVCLKDGEIVGTATGFSEPKFLHSGSFVFHIEDVCVRKEFRRMGVAKSLLETLEQMATQCYKIILDCSEENAKNLYEPLGYKSNGLCMRKNLLSH